MEELSIAVEESRKESLRSADNCGTSAKSSKSKKAQQVRSELLALFCLNLKSELMRSFQEMKILFHHQNQLVVKKV